MNSNIVGKKIKQYRVDKKMTQQELADRCGVNWETISRYERGYPMMLSNLSKIAEALDTDVGELASENASSLTGLVLVGELRAPYFTSKPINNDFSITDTITMHSIPEFVYLADKAAFVIDVSIVEDLYYGIKNSGVLYISRNVKCSPNDICLISRYDKLMVVLKTQVKMDDHYIGRVLGQEVSYL